MCKHSQRCLAAGNRKTDCPKGVQRQSQQSNAVLLAVAHIADLVNLVSNPRLRSDLERAVGSHEVDASGRGSDLAHGAAVRQFRSPAAHVVTPGKRPAVRAA